MRPAALALALALAAPAHAQPDCLDGVRGVLRGFAGSSPLQASLQRAVTHERKDRPLESGRVDLEVVAGPEGLHLLYPDALLERIRAERAQTDPEKPQPTVRTIEGFDAIDVAALANGAPALLHEIEDATCRDDTPDTYIGRPVRRLDLDLKVRTSKANSKWFKSAISTMRLWVTADNVPLAAESEFDFRVGFLMFTYDGKDVETHEYLVRADRLIATRYVVRFDGDGLGESQHNWSETTLHLTGS